ncbi:MAG TPA: hypothetical protein VNE62_06525 [Actinomycetota bacterium]|nr:hypothetical protein [Actinomycetota bacterium]
MGRAKREPIPPGMVDYEAELSLIDVLVGCDRYEPCPCGMDHRLLLEGILSEVDPGYFVLETTRIVFNAVRAWHRQGRFWTWEDVARLLLREGYSKPNVLRFMDLAGYAGIHRRTPQYVLRLKLARGDRAAWRKLQDQMARLCSGDRTVLQELV